MQKCVNYRYCSLLAGTAAVQPLVQFQRRISVVYFFLSPQTGQGVALTSVTTRMFQLLISKYYQILHGCVVRSQLLCPESLSDR